MVVFKATLSFAIAALGIFLMRNQTATQSNPIKQKLPTFDNSDPCWSCNSLEEDQKVEDNCLAIRNLFYYHVLSNTINLLKLYNCNPSTTELLSKSDPGIMASMLKPFVKYKSEQKQEKEQYQDQEKRSDQEKEQYQDQDQYKHQHQRQQEYEWKMVQKKPFGKQSGGNFVQDQIQDQDQDQDQHQQEYGRNDVEEKQGRDHGLVTWRKMMLRRMG